MEEYTLKFIALGDSSVGKTSILNSFVDGEFRQYTKSTLGIDTKSKICKIEGQPYTIQVWDTAGQEKYQTLTRSFYRRADGILLVFDLSKKQSFEHTRNWMQQIQNNAGKNVVVVMVGNKADLTHEVSLEEAKTLAQEFNIPYYSASAKSLYNIDNVFEYLAIAYLDKNPEWAPKNLQLKGKSKDIEISCCN